MNALVYVTLVSGKVNVYRAQTLDGAIRQMLDQMDAVCADASSIYEINLFTRFHVNPSDSVVMQVLKARNLSDKLN